MGVLITILVEIIIALVIFIIWLIGSKPIKEEMSEDEKRRYEATRKAFNELMEYDYDKALGGSNEE